MGVRNVNCREDGDLRVICPECGTGGGHNMNSYQPKCHKCGALMQPGSNKKVECGWHEFKDYFNGKKND